MPLLHWLFYKKKVLNLLLQEVPRVLYGALAIVSSDNLISLALGDFKKSYSALNICWHCIATKDESQTKNVV